MSDSNESIIPGAADFVAPVPKTEVPAVAPLTPPDADIVSTENPTATGAPANEAEQPRAPQPEKPKGESRETVRLRELKNVSNQMVYSEGAKVKKDVQAGTKKPDELTAGEKSAYAYYDLSEKAKAETPFKERIEPGDTDGKHPEKGAPLRVALKPGSGWTSSSAEDTKGRVINAIIGKKVENGQVVFVCEIEGQDEEQNIPASILLEAQLLSDENILTSHYPEGSPERAVIQAHFALLKNGATPPDTLDTQLETAGRKASQFSAETGRKYINKNLPEQIAAEGKTLTPEQTAMNEKRARLLARLENKLFLEPDDIAALMTETINPETISLQKTAIESDLRNCENQLPALKARFQETNNPQDHQNLRNMEGRIAQLQSDRDKFQQLQEQLLDPEPLIQAVVTNITSGQLPATTIMDLQAIMGEGDPVALAEAMFNKLKSDDPETQAEIDKWRHMIESLSKNGMMVGGGIILLTVMLALKSIEGMQ